VAISIAQFWAAHVCYKQLRHTIMNGKQCKVQPQTVSDDAELNHVDVRIKDSSLVGGLTEQDRLSRTTSTKWSRNPVSAHRPKQ
jgi:hypothetical protein